MSYTCHLWRPSFKRIVQIAKFSKSCKIQTSQIFASQWNVNTKLSPIKNETYEYYDDNFQLNDVFRYKKKVL